MFALHDRVRRRICIAGFFLLCLVPTALVVGWAVAWRLPSHVRGEARRIGHQMGFDVSLGSVEHLRPGAVRLLDVTIRDCEERQTVFVCRRLDAEMKTRTDRRGVAQRVLFLEAKTLSVGVEQLPALGKLVRRLLELRAGNMDIDLNLGIGRVDLVSETDKHVIQMTITEIEGGLRTVESGTKARLDFRVADQSMIERASITLSRNRDIRPPCEEFELCTGGAAFPCDMLAQAIAPMRSLGDESRFQGYIHAKRTLEGWQGTIRPAGPAYPPCEFLDVELDRLVTDRFAHTLSGTVNIAVYQADFREGRLQTLEGCVVGGPGRISSSLLSAAVEHLSLQPGIQSFARDELVDYDRLEFGFWLGPEHGLTLARRDWKEKPGQPILSSRQGFLLGQTTRFCSVLGLVRAMVPDVAIHVPATPQANQLASYLPVIEVVPAVKKHAHSRVADMPEPTRR